jgi:hypothetical protein
MVLVNAVIHGSESRGTHEHILWSQIRDSPNLKGQDPVVISPRSRIAQIYAPRHWVPFSSPPTTHRVSVEEFKPAYTRTFLKASISSIPYNTQKVKFVPYKKGITPPMQRPDG